MLDWDRIDTVLLDMDGTLLDLHFDTRFWLDHLPRAYGRARGLDRDAAWAMLKPRLKQVEGTLDWYCLDYWSRELGLDIVAMKQDLAHLIAWRDGARAFLRSVRGSRRRVVLITNAHAQSLALKLERTRLHELLDAWVCAHELGHPKESSSFWSCLQQRHPFDRARTLFVDDSLPVLRAAREHGIAHLLAVGQPDSHGPRRDTGEFRALHSFSDILPR
jgi:putative hydrolase of the HAD superfamily